MYYVDRLFQILWPSYNIWTFQKIKYYVVKLSKPESTFAYLGNNLKGKTGEIKDDQVTFTAYLCNARTSLGMFHLPDISDVLAQKRFLLFTNA